MKVFLGPDWYSRSGWRLAVYAFRRHNTPEGEYPWRLMFSVTIRRGAPFFWWCLIPAWKDEPTAWDEYCRTMRG